MKKVKSKIIKRVFSVLLCVVVFLGSFSVTSFAVSEDIFSPTDVAETQYKNWSELPDDFKALGEAYFNTFCNSNSVGSFFKNVSDIPISWFKVTKDSTPVLSPVGTLFYFLDGVDLKVYDNSRHSSTHGHSRGVNPDEDFVVPADDFIDYVGTTEKMYYPKNANGKMSYRTDERWQNKIISSGYNTRVKYCDISFFEGDQWGFSPIGGGKEMYIVLFYKTNTANYYGKYQFHFTITTEDIYYEDRDEVQSTNYTLNCEYWDMVDGSQEQATTVTIADAVNYKYFDFNFYYYNQLSFHGYSDYNKYVGYTGGAGMETFSFNPAVSDIQLMYSSDLKTSINPYSGKLLDHFGGKYSDHDPACSFGGACDIGYIASVTPISTLYTIDTTKIPNNYYVTVSGDTIYDYSITNPETGQKDTIQNFVTNNYTFTTINEGDNSGDGNNSSGSLSGDVKVDGNVKVDGKVDIGGKVDINVNVSSNSSGGDDVSLPDTDLVNNLPEAPQGFIDYLKKLFDFLPAPVLTVIIAAIAAAVFCRIWGR